MAFKYDIPPFTCRLVHGNYRIYDVNGQQIWKSDGKTHGDKEEAIQKINDIARRYKTNASKRSHNTVRRRFTSRRSLIVNITNTINWVF